MFTEINVNGQKSYVHVAWATSITGENFSLGKFDMASWVGVRVTEDESEVTDPELYQWVVYNAEENVDINALFELQNSVAGTTSTGNEVGEGVEVATGKAEEAIAKADAASVAIQQVNTLIYPDANSTVISGGNIGGVVFEWPAYHDPDFGEDWPREWITFSRPLGTGIEFDNDNTEFPITMQFGFPDDVTDYNTITFNARLVYDTLSGNSYQYMYANGPWTPNGSTNATYASSVENNSKAYNCGSVRIVMINLLATVKALPGGASRLIWSLASGSNYIPTDRVVLSAYVVGTQSYPVYASMSASGQVQLRVGTSSGNSITSGTQIYITGTYVVPV